MILLVRLIDLGVLYLRILGGRVEVAGAVRALAWIAFVSLALLGLGLFGFVVVHLLDVISAITGDTYR
ncbi:hypothetical protein [Rhodococcus sp. NPDC003348]